MSFKLARLKRGACIHSYILISCKHHTFSCNVLTYHASTTLLDPGEYRPASQVVLAAKSPAGRRGLWLNTVDGQTLWPRIYTTVDEVVFFNSRFVASTDNGIYPVDGRCLIASIKPLSFANSCTSCLSGNFKPRINITAA